MSLAQTSQTTAMPGVLARSTAKRCEQSLAMEAMLQETGHRGLRQVRVLLDAETVLLQGRVASYFLKQTAQEAVRPFASGLQIRNELRVP